MVMTGTLYSWAIFTRPLFAMFHWSLRECTGAYAIANFCLAAVGAVLGGFWQDRKGPRRVAMTGMALWGAGNLLAGLGTAAWGAPWLYLTYGAIGGVGAGMAYIAPVTMIVKWFPERKGLAGGVVAGGFGMGAFIYNQLVPRLPGFHAATSHADTAAPVMAPSNIAAVMHVFIASGSVYLIVGVLAAALFQNPPTPEVADGRAVAAGARQGLAPSAVVTTPQFYLLWLQLFAYSIAGITIISNAVLILQDLTGLPAIKLAPLFGLVSAFNAVGRLFWGAVSDRIGCRHTFALLFVIQAVVLFLLPGVHELSVALTGFAVVLLRCGGGFGTMPAYSSECFGTQFMGLNYGLILSAWGFAGLMGPLLDARARDLTGSFTGTLPLAAGLLLAAVILPYLSSRPGLGTASSHNPGFADRARKADLLS